MAQRLNVSVKTLQRWRWIGYGPPFIKIGRAVRYRDSDVEAFVQASRRTSTTSVDA